MPRLDKCIETENRKEVTLDYYEEWLLADMEFPVEVMQMLLDSGKG